MTKAAVHNNTHTLCVFFFFLALNCYFLRALGQKGVGGFELDRDVSAPHEVAEQTHMVFYAMSAEIKQPYIFKILPHRVC